ncbi:hypothetical protein [Arthrobacter alpinus]|uniref:hypothetical protein n=1 Tax=Arthrobacter alpinus TaxID=656366 RepID=UPI0013965D37|nr:hypothetical protein [Arthrobacter alpinus]
MNLRAATATQPTTMRAIAIGVKIERMAGAIMGLNLFYEVVPESSEQTGRPVRDPTQPPASLKSCSPRIGAACMHGLNASAHGYGGVLFSAYDRREAAANPLRRVTTNGVGDNPAIDLGGLVWVV